MENWLEKKILPLLQLWIISYIYIYIYIYIYLIQVSFITEMGWARQCFWWAYGHRVHDLELYFPFSWIIFPLSKVAFYSRRRHCVGRERKCNLQADFNLQVILFLWHICQTCHDLQSCCQMCPWGFLQHTPNFSEIFCAVVLWEIVSKSSWLQLKTNITSDFIFQLCYIQMYFVLRFSLCGWYFTECTLPPFPFETFTFKGGLFFGVFFFLGGGGFKRKSIKSVLLCHLFTITNKSVC